MSAPAAPASARAPTTSRPLLLLLLLALVLAAPHLVQSGPVASSGDAWPAPRHLMHARMLYPTCDHAYIWQQFEASCMSLRRRRRDARVDAAEGDQQEEQALQLKPRSERSPAPREGLLFSTCCERPCSVKDFEGVCP